MRLIDADALMNELMKVRCAYQMLDNTQRADAAMGGLRNAEKKVEEALTIDAVPVVRCRECKYAEVSVSPITGLWCTRFGINDMDMADDDFCSYGERNDDETI